MPHEYLWKNWGDGKDSWDPVLEMVWLFTKGCYLTAQYSSTDLVSSASRKGISASGGFLRTKESSCCPVGLLRPTSVISWTNEDRLNLELVVTLLLIPSFSWASNALFPTLIFLFCSGWCTISIKCPLLSGVLTAEEVKPQPAQTLQYVALCDIHKRHYATGMFVPNSKICHLHQAETDITCHYNMAWRGWIRLPLWQRRCLGKGRKGKLKRSSCWA